MASELLGKHWVPIPHSGTVAGRQTTGVSWQLIDKVEATEFGRLKRPSRQSPSCEAFIYRNGAEFMSNYCPTCGRGENWLKVSFGLV